MVFNNQFGLKEWTHHFKNNLILSNGQIKQVLNKSYDLKKKRYYDKMRSEIKTMKGILHMVIAFSKMVKIYTINYKEMKIII